MTEREQLAARWRAAFEWNLDPARAELARATGRRHYRGGWPGFPELPFALAPAPSDAEVVLLLGGYAEFDQLNLRHFNDLCPPVKLVCNARLRSTAARIDTLRRVLELNPGRLTALPETRVETIFHEMIHLWLYAQGWPSGHTPRFRAKMAERGHVSFGYGRDGDPKGPLHAYAGSEPRVVYRCPKCGQQFPRRRRYAQPMACGGCFRAGRGRHRLVEMGVASAARSEP